MEIRSFSDLHNSSLNKFSLTSDWADQITLDRVLRAMGSKPEVIKIRRPDMVRQVNESLPQLQSYLEPAVIYKIFPVIHRETNCLELEGSRDLSGELVSSHLKKASYISVMVCTIGNRLEEAVTKKMDSETGQAIILDGYGSSAVEVLSHVYRAWLDEQAAKHGFKTTISIAPGKVGWDLGTGQKQVFLLLNTLSINVELTSSGMMKPRKSISSVIGIGEEVVKNGTSCDLCAVNETCLYRDREAP